MTQLNVLQDKPPLTSPKLKKTAIIFDLDGVLVDLGPDGGTHIDWSDTDACNLIMINHKPDWRLISFLNFFVANSGGSIVIIILTGRPECYRAVTQAWLERHKVKFHHLMMREDIDAGLAGGAAPNDYKVKQKILQQIRRAYDVWFVVEDRNSVVKMWREEGLLCLQSREGDY